jgi:N-acyl-D-aspartate/D-glutamate deacylase
LTDIMLRGGLVYDGTGAPPVCSDVAITGGRVVEVGAGVDVPFSSVTIDCEGLCIAPGFIDVHSHDDFAIAADPGMAFKVASGVTTVVVGNCGEGPVPYPASLAALSGQYAEDSIPRWRSYRDYLSWVRDNPPAVNVAALAAHGTIRADALQRRARAGMSSEVRGQIEEALMAGTCGASLGLYYEPGRSAPRTELVAVALAVAGLGGILAVHLRDEGAGLLESLREVIGIAEETGVRLQISHHKAAGRSNHGLVVHSLRLLAAARAQGLRVACDQYPYTTSSTHLRDVLSHPEGIGGFIPESIRICFTRDLSLAGMSLAELASRCDGDAWSAAEKLVAVAPETIVILDSMSEGDVIAVLRDDHTMIGSDGLPNQHGASHPRLWGSFARVISRYACDQAVLSVAEAIRRMTSLPATTFGFPRRGTVEPGSIADLVVFSLPDLTDRECDVPAGIHHVLVNGGFAVREGVPTGERPGIVVGSRHEASAAQL